MLLLYQLRQQPNQHHSIQIEHNKKRNMLIEIQHIQQNTHTNNVGDFKYLHIQCRDDKPSEQQ